MPTRSLRLVSSRQFQWSVSTHLSQSIFVREQHCQHCASCQQILYLKGIEVRVVGGFVVVEHKVDGVRRCADEDDLEDGVVQRIRVVKGPKEVNVTTEVHDQVQKLRLERDTGRTLF